MESANGQSHLRSIFILDDDHQFLHYMKAVLSEPEGPEGSIERFDVKVFDNPYEFIAAVNDPEQSNNLVLVIVDYLLENNVNGLMVSYQLAKEWPDIAQIYCTSHANSRVKELLIKCKACTTGLMEKPVVSPEQAYHDVEEVLTSRDEFFARFAYRESTPPFVIPRVPRPQASYARRKADRRTDAPGEDAPGAEEF